MDIVNGIISFIIIVIVMGFGANILGSGTTDCTKMDGYDANLPANSTGWAGACVVQEESAINAYGQLPMVLTVIVFVIVLSVIMLLRNNQNS